MTPDKILRDRLVLGIRDDRLRERLLRSNALILQQAVDQIKSSEQTQQQVKDMIGGDSLVHALQKSGFSDHAEDERNPRLPPSKTTMKECGNRGMSHGRDCPAYGKTCFTCGRRNHFVPKCHEEGETESQLFMKPQTLSKNRTTSARLRSTNPSREWPSSNCRCLRLHLRKKFSFK